MTSFIRLKREIPKCKSLDKVVSLKLINENIFNVEIIIKPNTLVFKREYTVVITTNSDYPFVAPKVIFCTKVFHPNISEGNICLTRLNEWKSSYTLDMVVGDILELFENPNLNDPINLKAANMWGCSDYDEEM